MEGGKDLQFLELFAGTGRVTRLAKSLGYSSEAHDVIYDKRLEEGYDRNCMDIAGEAGYAFLAQELSQYFSPTAECFGVFSHSKGFGADRSSSKTHSPKVPRFQVKVPK